MDKPMLPTPEDPSAGDQEELNLPDDDDAQAEDPMARLRRCVAECVTEIKKLREKNEKLQRKVRRLERNPFPDETGTIVKLEDDAKPLRKQIDSFIDAIDEQLAELDASE